MAANRGGMSICSQLKQTLSEMEVRTFVRIQRVIWEHLLNFKGEIIQKQALFWFPCRTLLEKKCVVMLSVLFFSFVLFSSPPRKCFGLNHVRKVRKECSHPRFSSQAIILGIFDRNVGLCCSCFSVAMGGPRYFFGSSNDAS